MKVSRNGGAGACARARRLTLERLESRLLLDGVAPSGIWQELDGSASGGGISDNASGIDGEPAIAAGPDGDLFVAWSDGGGMTYEIYVRKWDASEGSWVEMGAGSASGGGISNMGAYSMEPSIAVDQDGAPVIVWSTYPYAPTRQVYGRRWNEADGTWDEMGGSGSGLGISNGAPNAQYCEVVIDGSNAPVVAWGAGGDVYVLRWDEAASAWQEMGGSATGEGLSPDVPPAFEVDIAVDATGAPVVAWCQYAATTGSDRFIYAKRWDAGSSSWVEMAGSASGRGLSADPDPAFHPSVAVDGADGVVVSWASAPSGEQTNIYARRWDSGLDTWQALGSSMDEGGLSASSLVSYYPDIAIDATGAPVVVWSDYSDPGGDWEIYARRWDSGSGQWQEMDGSGAGGGLSDNTTYSYGANATVDSQGRVTVAWYDWQGTDAEVYVRQLFNPVGSIAGVAFEDLDGDGVRDPGEPGMAGVTVGLDVDGDTVADATTLTDADGAYGFTDLDAGDYAVFSEAPAGRMLTVPGGGSYDVSLSAGEDRAGLNFGNQFRYRVVEQFQADGSAATVTLVDFQKDGAVAPGDAAVKFKKDGAVASIAIAADGSGQPGVLVSGAPSVGAVKETTKAGGSIAVIASDAPIAAVKLNSPLTGANLNGLDVGGLAFPSDLDGDGIYDDATALYTAGWMGKVALGSGATGDVLAMGADPKKGVAVKAFAVKSGDCGGDLYFAGHAGKVMVGGDLDGSVEVLGDLKGLATKGGGLAAAVSTTGSLRKVSVQGGDLASAMSIGGDLLSVAVKGLKDKASGTVVGGCLSGADLDVAGMLKAVKATGDFMDSDIDAGTLGKVALKGTVGQTGGSHFIRADDGSFALADANWKGVIEPGAHHTLGGVLLYVGSI